MSDGSAIFTLTSRLQADRTLAGSRRGHCARSWMATTLLGLWFISGPSWSGKYARDMIHEVHQPLPYKWTKFVEVQGQPESIPAEWVSTAEGRFAHAIKIPNPLPKDSGYKWRMSSKEYFLHLCEKEAGEFTYRRAESVDGVLFMRPPDRPSDYDLMDRYKLEAPSFQRIFQLMRPTIEERGLIFGFSFVEEPVDGGDLQWAGPVMHASEARVRPPAFTNIARLKHPVSRYGVTWRGIRRVHDRDKGIAGTEVIVLDLQTHEVMGVLREYGMTGTTRNTRDGIWWLNALRCPQLPPKYHFNDGRQISDFMKQILQPNKN